MYKTAPANHIVFRYLRECREDSDQDLHLGLRARGHFQKATRSQDKTLHNFTDFEPDLV